MQRGTYLASLTVGLECAGVGVVLGQKRAGRQSLGRLGVRRTVTLTGRPATREQAVPKKTKKTTSEGEGLGSKGFVVVLVRCIYRPSVPASQHPCLGLVLVMPRRVRSRVAALVPETPALRPGVLIFSDKPYRQICYSLTAKSLPLLPCRIILGIWPFLFPLSLFSNTRQDIE